MLSAARFATVSTGLGRRAASSIAIKYSNAAYRAALTESPTVLDKVQRDLASISKAIKDRSEATSFILNPTLSASDRKVGLAALISKLEGGPKPAQLSSITKNLLAVLSDNGRLGETLGVIEGFNELVAQYKKELTVVVTSATPLPRDVLARLETTLKQSETAKRAETLKIVNKVNPSLMGGMLVDFGDKTIDLSVSSRVTRLNNALQQPV